MKSYIAKTGGGAAYIGQWRRRRRHSGLSRAGVGVGLLVIEMLHVYRRIRHLLRASIPLTFKASKMMRSRAQATTTPSSGRGAQFADRRGVAIGAPPAGRGGGGAAVRLRSWWSCQQTMLSSLVTNLPHWIFYARQTNCVRTQCSAY